MIKKRVVLLVAVALMIGAAPAALAEHCLRCGWSAQLQEPVCKPAINMFAGWTECEDGGGTCSTSGTECEPHGSGLAPLATEYTVASVERLDDAPDGADETLIAEANLSRPTTTR